jgi:serine/threonine protein kinase
MSSEVQPLIPSDPTAFGGWKLLGRLGKGGFSTIYLGEKNGQLSAIKMIRKELLGEAIVFERFATEIRNLEKLTHDGIAKLIDDDLSTEVPYIAMEYVQGETLEQYVLKNGSLPEPEWLKILESVTSTLEYCHSKGIVHKDIGPGNIMLGKDGPKLIDFGISYEQGSSRITQADQIVGTPSYMSPEHLSGQITEAMDVFSLGATFAFAGTGREPFESNSRSQTRTSITLEMPKLEGLSKLQRELVEPLLYKKASDRPPLNELLAAIKTFHENGTLGNYTSYNRRRNNKLVSRNVDIGKQRRIRNIYRLAISIAASIALIFGAYAVLTQNNLETGTKLITENQSTTNSQIESGNGGVTVPSSVATNTPDSKVASSSSRECEAEYDRKSLNVLKACLPSAKAGDLTSIFYIGRDYFANSNYKEAEKWFLIGANKKDLNSVRYLIDTYTQLSKTKERDRWTKICADTSYGQTETSPLKDIAYCKMLQGLILTRTGSTKEAILYLSDAADYGNGDAATWLGTYYRDLDDRANALKWLKRAAELGNNLGIDALIIYADEIGDKELTRKWLTVSAESGNQVNMGVLAQTYYSDKDLAQAKKWATKGVSFGDLLSTYVLGAVTYDSDQKEEGKKLLLKAANKGIVNAIRKLGSIYRLDEKNFSEASIWYEKLAARNDFSGTAFYSALLFMLGRDQESCTFNDKLLELGNQAKKNGTYNPDLMDKDMERAKTTAEDWCFKLYKK